MQGLLGDFHLTFHFVELLFIIYLVFEVRQTKKLLKNFLELLTSIDVHLTSVTTKMGQELDKEDVPIK